MNQQKQVKSSSMFLLELIFAIFFFSIASAVCVQIFVKAHMISQSSQALNFAVNECCGMAEVITTSEDLADIKQRLAVLYPMAELTAFPSVNLYYDANFEPCTLSGASYQLTFRLQDISQTISLKADSFSTFEVQIAFEDLAKQAQIYNLDIKHHISQEVQR